MRDKIKARAASTISAVKRNMTPQKQVQLKLVHINFWSAVRVALLVTIAMGIATLVGFTLLWAVVSQTGLFGSLNSLVNSVIGGSGADIGAQLSLPRVLSFATTLAFFNIVLGTLLTGVCALIFNVIGRITGGISVGFTNN
jgi:hypothetical protein